MRTRVADPADAVDGTDRPQQLAEQRADAHVLSGLAGREREVAPVAVDVLTEEGDLGDAALGQPGHLVDESIERAGDLLAANRRDDAEGAGVVAADLDGDPRGVALVAPGRHRRGEQLVVVGDGGLEDLGQRTVLPAGLEQLGGAVDVVGAEHEIDVGRPLPDALLVLLGEAPGHHDLHARVAVLHGLEVPEGAVELVVRVLPDAARVEDHDIGLFQVVGRFHPIRIEQPGDPLRVVLVHLTPERPHEVALRGVGGIGHGSASLRARADHSAARRTVPMVCR